MRSEIISVSACNVNKQQQPDRKVNKESGLAIFLSIYTSINSNHDSVRFSKYNQQMMETAANSFLFTTKSRELTGPSDIRVILDPKYNRRTSRELEESIDQIWNKRLAELPSMFNGTKFRLHSVAEKDDKLFWHMGVSCYKDFQGTNLSDNALVLQSQGLSDFDDSQTYMSDALGVGALVLTVDDHMVLLFRSKNCGEDIGLWDRPGGHPEPKNIIGKIPMEYIDLASMSEDAVVKEVFQSIIEEVKSEVNLPEEFLEPPRILGLHRSNLNAGKPNVEFLVKCKLTAAEVKSRYAKGGHEEAYESEQVLLLPMDKALCAETSVPHIWSKMAAGAKGSLYLYNLYKHRFLL